MSKVLDGEGVVNKVGEKVFNKKTYYNFTLVDDDTLYRTGDTAPDIETGDVVAFEYQDTGKYGCVVDLDSLEVTGHEEVKPKRKKTASRKKATASRGKKPAAANGSGHGGMATKDDYWKNKELTDEKRQRAISYNAAVNTALALLSKELDAGLLELATPKAKAAAKLDAFEALLFEKAEEIWERFADAANRMPGASKDVADDEIEEDQYDEEEEDEEFDDD